jgi:DTW domain-containing protein YfiP
VRRVNPTTKTALPASDPLAAEEICPLCGKPMSLSVCNEIVPVENRVELLVLQHPQEQDKALGTARLAVVSLRKAALRIGLSWPSLSKALGRQADPKRWAVLYLGALRPKDFPSGREVMVLDRKGKPVDDRDSGLAHLEGIVVFDGTWSQAKALWWRNPWVLKAHRVALNPKRPSLYGTLRREPRREGLSTIEAAGMLIAKIEKRPEIEQRLSENFQKMLTKLRTSGVSR